MLRRLLSCRAHFSTSAALRHGAGHGNLSGSAKLFADAAKEEAEVAPVQPIRGLEEPNWTGEERIEDTVLRMLVDRYKPLRTGTIQTAQQKLRQAPPRIAEYHIDAPPIGHAATPPPASTAPQPSGALADAPLLPPGPPGHRPWHTEFKVPAHATPFVRFARFPAPPRAVTGKGADPDRDRASKAEKERTLQKVGRLTRARESTLDYRLGLAAGAKGTNTATPRVNPVNMKGWTSLIEDKIEQARRAGLFASVNGRGKPIVRTVEESNPFIAREEFLMNRIVQRNGAAPPWVQLQAELDTAVHTFRHLLLDGWTRHAVRALTVDGPPRAVHAFRDPAWAQRERAFHATALAEVNGLVRRYNALAPHAVRRTPYALDAELAGVYERAAEGIGRALAERAVARAREKEVVRAKDDGLAHRGAVRVWRLRDVILSLLRRLARLVRIRTR
ncbi:hypothetical protein B0H10DRAFT_2218092 [Mycena sp. CBHHK59/15]|nr:hypothetical protein B0H10DRAFT_2218092 [Mycena sp. CBHHK59/15]